MADDDDLRDSEEVDNVREKGGIRMIISVILCLFANISCRLFFTPLDLWSHTKIDYAVKSIGVDLHRIITGLESG